jgi:hypothetical protein
MVICTCWLRNAVFQSMFSRKPLRERRAIEREKACENRTLINGILVSGEKKQTTISNIYYCKYWTEPVNVPIYNGDIQ